MNGLHGKTFIVAGGATGIGAATAERLGSEGALVTVGDINLAEATATAQRITASGGRAIAVEFDLADEQSVQELVDRTIAEFGARARTSQRRRRPVARQPWPRHHPAGHRYGRVETHPGRQPARLRSHQPRDHSAPAGTGRGSIVNTSSGGSLGSDPLHVAYGASKAAVNQLTRHIATNWGRAGIRCNCVMPGLVIGETQKRQGDIQQMQEAFVKIARTTRLGEPRDLAAVITFLLSDDAEWINGQTWSIDGGVHLRQ